MKLAGWSLILGMAALAAFATPLRAAEEAATEEASAEAPTTEELAGKLEGLTEQLQVLQADTDKLKRFKFSGYVQARWETAENKTDSVRVTGATPAFTATNPERFYIRRARLKLTYDASPLSQAVVYIDGGADRTVRLLEAYLTLLDPWTPDHRHQLTAGQMNVPFGYEIERSSSVRELPERSRAENVLFSGERDRGIKLVSQWIPQLETVVGLYNGGGVNDPEFPATDPTRGKDVTGRVRLSLGVIDAAASYYTGRALTALTGPDVRSDRTRLGFDAQAIYALPTLGGGSLRGEWYQGMNVNADSIRTLVFVSGAARLLRPGADAGHLATDFTGGYVMWVQNLGEKLQAAARWDLFDLNTDVDHDQFERVSLGANYFYDGFTRITAAYDIITTDVAAPGGGFIDPKDNLWTIQFQHKF